MAKKAKSGFFSSSPKSLLSSSPMSKMAKSGFFSSSSPISLLSSSSQTFSQSMMEDTVDSAEEVIRKWDTESLTYTKIVSLFQHSRREAKEFIRSVWELRRAMNFLVAHHSHSVKLVLAQNLMQSAMARLEKEFYQILSMNRDQLDPESVSGQSSNGSNNSEFEYDLENVYDGDELKKAGESITEVEKASAMAMSDIHHRSEWSDLEHMIKNWIEAAKIGVRTLFRGEKLLCDHVFSVSKTIRESCFYEIGNEAGTNLFRFPELITKGKKSPDRIFRLMDLHSTISDLWQDIELIFHFDAVSTVKLQALSSMEKLADSIRTLLVEFESTIQKDSSKTVAPGGGIHKLTRSTMSFISSLSEYSCVLSGILAPHPLPRNTRSLETYFGNLTSEDEPNRIVSVHLAWLILVLLCKLDTKAELYKDVSLSYLFHANNLQFTVDTTRSSQLRNLLGYDRENSNSIIGRGEITLQKIPCGIRGSIYETIGMDSIRRETEGRTEGFNRKETCARVQRVLRKTSGDS